MNRAEEISMAFDLGKKAFIDRNRDYFPSANPPADWPEHAKQEFRDGYTCAEQNNTWTKRRTT